MAWDVPFVASAGQQVVSCWDMNPAPLLLPGSDGKVHETRPTTSLAHDLAKSELLEVSQTSTPSRARRRPDPDDRPLHGDLGTSGAVRSSCSGAGCRRVSAVDRPLVGFGSSSGNSGVGSSSGSAGLSFYPQRRASASSYNGADTSAPSRRNSAASWSTAARNSPRTSTSPSGAGNLAARRRSLRPYEPFDRLLSMGFDEESARAAIVAAGGDVDRAIRLVLEDSKAHDARQVCEWEFEGEKGWLPFDLDSEAILRAAIDRGDQACELRAGGNRYLVDFDSLTQLNLASKRLRRIRRRGQVSAPKAAGA
eukprot:TRINITY_DN83026_c0_g1_i1.p1 TRINITY_DN83026_c0_g1~~TRINITY_DN83026_c0_g1_i1.p1  ORF type:complete len:309 (+),score=55.33 TRINITY_DN83026_c0_g1_i1:82-1008(+)